MVPFSFERDELDAFQLPRPAVVCPCSLGFSSGTPLPISAGLGS